MRSRVRWAGWLLSGGCVAAVAVVGPVGHRAGPHAADVVAGAALALLAGAVWAVVVASGGARRCDSGPTEQRRVAQAWWGAGRELTRQLVAGVPPPPLTLWGLVLAPEEVAYLEVPVFYSRFCALDPVPVTGGRSVYYLGGRGGGGSGAMLVAATTSLLVESVELSRARDGARTRWRGHQHTRAVVTDRRLLVLWHGRWLPYAYSQVIGFYPDLEHGQVRLEFPGACAPIRLQGPAVPSIAALLCWALHGPDGLRSHPGLHALR